MRAKMNGVDVIIVEMSKSGRTCLIQYCSGYTEVVDTFCLEY